MEAELEAEQEFVDLAYARLDAMRGDANSMLEGVLDLGKGGTFQSRTERDVIVRTSLARLEQLDIGDQALTFGRIDRLSGGPAGTPTTADGGPDGPTETFHIGRLAIHGADHEPLVVDWRAPVAEPFYRATGRDPLGLVLRRHLAMQGRTVVSVEDERFTAPGGPTDTVEGADGVSRAADPGGELIEGDLPIGGPAALLAALDRARSGRMTDIVSTIQAEQDEIIRVAAERRARRPGRPRHRQDGGGPAPRRLPALHPPVPARAPGRAGGRPQPPLPPLHRTGAAVAGGDRRDPVDHRRTGARDPDQGERAGRRRPPEG